MSGALYAGLMITGQGNAQLAVAAMPKEHSIFPQAVQG